MVDVIFNLNPDIIIQAKINEPFQSVIDKFIQKTSIALNSVYFFANGKQINPQQTVESHICDLNKKNKTISVYVYFYDKDDKDKEQVIIQSKDIICPECKEPCRYTI